MVHHLLAEGETKLVIPIHPQHHASVAVASLLRLDQAAHRIDGEEEKAHP